MDSLRDFPAEEIDAPPPGSSLTTSREVLVGSNCCSRDGIHGGVGGGGTHVAYYVVLLGYSMGHVPNNARGLQ